MKKEDLQKKVKSLNKQITYLKLFVVFFCLATVLLSTYHIHRLNSFSSKLALLMEVHAGTMIQLNIIKQIKSNNGYATGGLMLDEFRVRKQNHSIHTFQTQKQEKAFELFENITIVEKVKKKHDFRKKIENEYDFDFDHYELPIDEFYDRRNDHNYENELCTHNS